MKKRFTFLISCCLAFLWLGSGNVWAQTWWGSGCVCDGATANVGNVGSTYHSGLNIDGTRYTYWFTYGNASSPWHTAPITQYEAHASSANSSSGTGVRWVGGVLHRVEWWWTNDGGHTHSSGLNPGDPGYWPPRTDYENTYHETLTAIPYPVSDYPYNTGTWQICHTGNIIDGEHLTSNPTTHKHGEITINVNSNASCGATHFKWLHWGAPTWGHYNFSYNSNSNSWTRSGSQSPLTTNEGYFILTDGVNMRLEGAAQFDATGTNIAKREVKFSGNYSIRFDEKFAGTTGATSVVGSQSANLASNIGTGNTIGLWKGTDYALSFVNGGTLLLGPNSGDQSLINLNATGGSIDVNNYVCCDGSTLHSGTDPLWATHGMYFNVTGIITNTNATQINIENLCNVTCDNNDFGTTKNSQGYNHAWLIMDGSKLPDLWKGNVFASASGAVKYPIAVNASAATGTHEVKSRNNSLIFDQDFIVNNTDANGYENYHVDGGCCASMIYAHGLQSYTLTGAGKFDMKTAAGKIIMDKNFVYTGVNGNMNMEGEGGIVVGNVAGGDQGVFVTMTGTGDANMKSNSGSILMKDSLVYSQTATSSNGLNIWANGVCDPFGCADGGYIYILGPVEINNALNGYTNLQSMNSHILMANKFVHTHKGASTSGLNIEAENYIQIYDTTRIEVASETNSVIKSHKGDIEFGRGTSNLGAPFIYAQTGCASLDTGLYVVSGFDYSFNDFYCGNTDCESLGRGTIGTDIWFDGKVTISNADGGFTRIHAKGDSLHMDKTFQYDAGSEGGDLELMATTGVGIEDTVMINFAAAPNTTDIRAYHGYVHVGGPFKYEDNGVNATDYLHILAQGPCDNSIGCNPLGGFIWLEDSVITTNKGLAWTTMESENHYIRMDKTLTHQGQNGNLNILAGSKITNDNSACDAGCGASDADHRPEYVLSDPGTFISPHHSRGYIWIDEPVTVTMKGTSPNEGNATFRSYGDIVQFDDSVTFLDDLGSNLLVDGLWGVRSRGVTTITNNEFDPTGVGTTSLPKHVNDNPNSVDYAVTTGQGFATYLSSKGFVDFGLGLGGASASDGYKFSYTTKGAATANKSALLVQGHSRVYFGDSVTITMGSNSPTNRTTGNAKIYSPAGWIMFADTTQYVGTNGDLIVYANGGSASLVNDATFKADIIKRSHLNPANTCDADRGGFILFDSITQIKYAVDKLDDGQTWIRSQFDDVVMGDMFTYTSADPTTHPAKNGEFVMQAGQDIYGKSFDDTIHFVQPGDSSILLEAKKTIHMQQMLYVDRDVAVQGDITLKAGYNSFADPAVMMSSNAADYIDAMPSAALAGLGWGAKGDCNPIEYASRFAGDEARNVTSPGSMLGGDIWFEGRVWVDLTKTKSTSKTIATTLRAFNSIFVDSTFVYDQDTATNIGVNDNVLLFAEMGNIEAAVTRQDKADFQTSGYVADDTVRFAFNANFEKEFRMQAGNQVWDEITTTRDGITYHNENAAPTEFFLCWAVGDDNGAEFDGNILYNKPFLFNHKGTGYSIISAARDIETQVMAPFIFTYDGTHKTSGDLDVTAGRHIETHAMMQFNHPVTDDITNITMEAGRLEQATLSGNDQLCKATEEGTSLTSNGTDAFDPDVETGGVNGAINNAFAAGGKGQGSILLFDSLEFNYAGQGTILMVAENGNIESDPYLHRQPGKPANPGQNPANGGTNWADGYMPFVGYSRAIHSADIQHDAQITFNHSGMGVTQLKAIDIKLHDKIAYYGSTAAGLKNGQLYISAYDSILTRNIEYVNPLDTGSVFITTDKLKRDSLGKDLNCGDYLTAAGGRGIHQGHIVLGYGADCTMTPDDASNMNDSIVFNFAGNTNEVGANVIIRAGYAGFNDNKITGKLNGGLFTNAADRDKGYGGNITFDFLKADMAKGNGTRGGYMEISTPNGNIWGKDSMYYYGENGDLLVDAGLGSVDDTLRAVRWSDFTSYTKGSGSEKTLNTKVPLTCDQDAEWRTGNIMMKGALLNFRDGKGNATFRTREGFIDTYDAFTASNMEGSLLKYAGSEDASVAAENQWGDVSERDFQYTPTTGQSGSVFFGADDNIMLNYGYSNAKEMAYDGRGAYDISAAGLADNYNPFYSTTYKMNIDACRSIYDVNTNGYMWYHHQTTWPYLFSSNDNLHRMYRGCEEGGVCSPNTGECETSDNKARDLTLDFSNSTSGGFASVATNYIDVFTKFTYFGGDGSGLHSVPGMTTLKNEAVAGYGLYMKSQFDGVNPEKRRATCEGCDDKSSYPMEGQHPKETYEWTYIGFHDDARIHTHEQKSLLEAPVIEFFGHAELDAETKKGATTELILKADSFIFHDSAIFDGTALQLLPLTGADERSKDMRYGVINDHKWSLYDFYGPAIEMEDRSTPVLELGYQRCNSPRENAHGAPNLRSDSKLEREPKVGGDVIVAFKHDFSLPIYNTVVANHARISFISDSIDLMPGGKYVEACVRTDLLRIRNKVEFYTDPTQPVYRRGTFEMTSNEQLKTAHEAGMFARHLHLEPSSELSIPGENNFVVISTTTFGGYGTLHENVMVETNGILAPGYASLMESDCQTPNYQGTLTMHNLKMEKDAVFRVSMNRKHQTNPVTGETEWVMSVDNIVVKDSIYLFGRVPIYVLPQTEYVEEGCYLIVDYGDTTGVSQNYLNHFYLVEDRYQDMYFSLDASEKGKLYLCVSSSKIPPVRRYIDIPEVEGVTTIPVANKYYVTSQETFNFTATYSGSPLKVSAVGFNTGNVNVLNGVNKGGSTYLYTIKHVYEPINVLIGPDPASGVANDMLQDDKVWAHKNTLYVNTDEKDVVSIYTATGILYRKYEVPGGLQKYVLEKGVYVVTLNDGVARKIIIN